MKAVLAALLFTGIAPAPAQEAGWHYSPYDGEGDRAAMGCATGSTKEAHACVVVRCEDDKTTAVYIDTSRAGGDVGEWTLQVDDANPLLVTQAAPGAPYGARITGTDTSIPMLVHILKLGSVAFLQPLDGAPVANAQIPLTGSELAINQALYYCDPLPPLGN